MALNWKPVVDGKDPNALADFGAAVLEDAVEDPGTLIAQLRASGQLPEAAITEHGGDETRDGLESLVARLEALGAQRVEVVDQGPAGPWWVMRDPEGNKFCAA